MRKLAKEVVGDNMVSESGAFTFPGDNGGEVIREVPFVYVPNFIAKLADVVSQHESYVDKWSKVITGYIKPRWLHSRQ